VADIRPRWHRYNWRPTSGKNTTTPRTPQTTTPRWKNHPDRIEELEEEVQQLQSTVDDHKAALDSLVEELREVTNAIKQLINDKDTKITIESVRREKDIKT